MSAEHPLATADQESKPYIKNPRGRINLYPLFTSQYLMPDLSSNAPGGGDKKSIVRTMKGDVEEMFKKTKPSFLKIISQETARSSSRSISSSFPQKAHPLRRILVIVFSILFLAGVGGGGFLFWKSRQGELAPTQRIAPPNPFFASESSRTINGDVSKPNEFLQLLNEREDERGGTIKRVLVKLEESAGERFATFPDLVNLLNLAPPKTLLTKTTLPVNIYFHYQKDSGEARFGFATRVGDQDRTWADMLGWESSILGDLRQVILKEKLQINILPFEDRTFRNIDWRYQKLSQEKDIGIAYTIFPAKNLLVLTSSKEMMETIINRLFEAR